jgi:hypothetical protein
MVVTPASPIAVATPVAVVTVTTFAVAKAEDFLDFHFFSLLFLELPRKKPTWRLNVPRSLDNGQFGQVRQKYVARQRSLSCR